MAVVGHPSREARLQPQHIVMRYICQWLCAGKSIVLRYIATTGANRYHPACVYLSIEAQLLPGNPNGIKAIKTYRIAWTASVSAICPNSTTRNANRSRESARVRNFQTCLDGAGECDTTQLTVNQKQQVENATHDRNLQSCLEALGQCDQAKFSSQEQQDVSRVNQDRNLRECLDGSDECDRGRLTTMEQREMAGLNGVRKLQN
jgi:hypothetical protein